MQNSDTNRKMRFCIIFALQYMMYGVWPQNVKNYVDKYNIDTICIVTIQIHKQNEVPSHIQFFWCIYIIHEA